MPLDGIGGGQFKQAIQQIIQAESQPIRHMEARKAKEESRLKLLKDFKDKFTAVNKSISELSSFKQFRELKADVGEGAPLMGVTIDKEKAEPGQYSIEIDSLASRSSSISNGFNDPDEANLGAGFISFKSANGESNEVYIDEKDASLNGISSAINRNPDLPVRSAVIKDASDSDAPWKLLLTSKKGGENNDVSDPEFYFYDGDLDFFVDDKKQSQNAKVSIDGFPVELESNDLKDFLPGVNIHLKQAKPEQPFTLSITEDTQKTSGKMKELVDGINGVLQFIVKQNSIDENTDTSVSFAGDSTLQSIEYQIRNSIHRGYRANPGSDSPRQIHLTEIGIEFDKSGQITFKEEKFNKALENDFSGIAEAISGPEGFSNVLRNLINSYVTFANSTLNTKEKGLRDQIKHIDQEIENKTDLIDKRKQALRDKFARLETTLGNLQQQQQYLSANMPGAGGGGDMISQLLG